MGSAVQENGLDCPELVDLGSDLDSLGLDKKDLGKRVLDTQGAQEDSVALDSDLGCLGRLGLGKRVLDRPDLDRGAAGTGYREGTEPDAGKEPEPDRGSGKECLDRCSSTGSTASCSEER